MCVCVYVYIYIYIWNVQCDVQNDECHINMSAVMQPTFQLWFSAYECGHSFLAPKA